MVGRILLLAGTMVLIAPVVEASPRSEDAQLGVHYHSRHFTNSHSTGVSIDGIIPLGARLEARAGMGQFDSAGSEQLWMGNAGLRAKLDLSRDLALINSDGVFGYFGAGAQYFNQVERDFGYRLEAGIDAEMLMPGVFVDTALTYSNVDSYTRWGLSAEIMIALTPEMEAGVKFVRGADTGVTFGFRFTI